MSRRWIVVGLIFLGILISYIDRGNLSIAAVPMMRDFELPPTVMGVLLSAFFWTYALFQIPAGVFVDRFGIRWVYAGAFLVWSIASASIALCRGTGDVLSMRLLLGMAEAVGPIASVSFIRQNFHGKDQGLPTAIYFAGQNVGPALGALLGSILMVHFGWRAMFALTGLGALLWLPFWMTLAPRGRPAVEHPKPTAPPQKLPWRQLVGSRAFIGMSVAVFLFSYFWTFVLTWVPTYLTVERGFSTLEMGRVLSIPLFTMAAFSVAAGSVADRLAARVGNVFRVRLLFSATGFACSGLLLLLLVAPNRSFVLPILLVTSCAMGLGNTSFWAIAQHAPPKRLIGRTIGYLNTLSQLAGSVAPIITGWMLGPQKHFASAIAVSGICPLLACGCLLISGAGGLEEVKGLLADSTEARTAAQ